MTPFTLFFAILGVSYVSWLIMKFIVWLDGADQFDVEDDAITVEPAPAPMAIHTNHKKAA